MARPVRVDVDTSAMSDADADVWLRRLRLRLFPTAPESPIGRRLLAARAELDRITARGQARGARPATIAAEARLLLDEHGVRELLVP